MLIRTGAEAQSVVVALVEDPQCGHRMARFTTLAQSAHRQGAGQALPPSDPARRDRRHRPHRKGTVHVPHGPRRPMAESLCLTRHQSHASHARRHEVPHGLGVAIVALLHPTHFAPDAVHRIEMGVGVVRDDVHGEARLTKSSVISRQSSAVS